MAITLDDPRAGRRIHDRLCSSLEQLVQSGVVRSSESNVAIADLSNKLRNGAVLRPERFRDYFAVIRAVQAQKRRQIEGSARSLAKAGATVDPEVAIRPLSDVEFSKAEQRALRGDFASESLAGHQITRVPDADVPATKARIEAALDLARRYAPQSYRLLTAITREIVPVRGRVRNGMTFDGCSSVERWGAILINVRIKRSDLVLAETLVHESNHSYLFDLTNQDRLSENRFDERYKSPLRIDPRPIDGIFHACFVLAHMYAFDREVAECETAPEDLRAEADKVSKERAKAFNDGYSVLAEHAKLTEKGAELLDRVRQMVPA